MLLAGEHPARDSPDGLDRAEAVRRLTVHGPNAIEEQRVPAWRRLGARFWGPLAWMLEVTIVLTLVLGKDLEAGIIAALLVVNSLIGFQQSARAERALALLKTRLAVNARVRRDGHWSTIPSREVVPGDVVRVRAGDLVPADLDVTSGHINCDQSALTGESVPVDILPGGEAYGSSVVTRGEATGTVTATGSSSFFGRTSQLVQSAQTASHLESIIFQVVKYLVVVDVAVVLTMFGFALAVGTPISDTLPFALIILIASVPIALPTTFTVAQAVGALELSQGKDEEHRGHGVLVTRLSAVQEAASMDILCTDKTGTLTLNQLELADTRCYLPSSDAELLELAALSSDRAGQDPIDLAILRATDAAGLDVSAWRRTSFEPFDPSTKRTETSVEREGETLLIVKGMPEVIARSCRGAPDRVEADVEDLAQTGSRVVAVAAGARGCLHLVGLLGLADRPRPDSAQLITELRSLGVDVKMITGDTLATALAVAGQVGIHGPACTADELRANPELVHSNEIFAGVLPEDKFAIVRRLQDHGHVVAMTGDGVNDAPALKQAEVGIAVDSAVDVAKAAASMVLTEPGLVDVVAAVRVSRGVYQRMLTWTLNKIVKTLQVALFLTLSFVITRDFVTTPFLIVLLLFANDFVTMALAVDRSRPSAQPDRWRVDALTLAAAVIAAAVLAESFVDLFLARAVFHLGLHEVQTLMFVMLVFTGQATVYLVRERGRLWTSRPGGWLVLATCVDVVIVTALATTGTFMTSVSLLLVLLVLGIAVVSMFAMDGLKVRVLQRLDLH
jgi:H+-transporting ATPase